MYTFDNNSNFTDGDKKRMNAIMNVFNSVDLYFSIGDYRCSINPSTYATFEKTNKGEEYKNVLERYIKMMTKGCSNINDVYRNIYASKGYTKEELDEDLVSGRFEIFLGNVIDEVMCEYKNGDFNLVTEY